MRGVNGFADEDVSQLTTYVVGDHQHLQERPIALVVLRDDCDASDEGIREFLSARVAKWQTPDLIEFVDDLPKTGVGKIDKRRLRDEVAPGLP